MRSTDNGSHSETKCLYTLSFRQTKKMLRNLFCFFLTVRFDDLLRRNGGRSAPDRLLSVVCDDRSSTQCWSDPRSADLARELRLGIAIGLHTPAALDAANLRAIGLLVELRDALRRSLDLGAVVVSGCVGPRGDGYKPGRQMSAAEAEDYHCRQIEVFFRSAADMVAAITINYANEALGITRAARGAGMPVAVSFTVETDGRLPTGQPLRLAIEQLDEETDGYPCYYMINCAHPTPQSTNARHDSSAARGAAVPSRGLWFAAS